MSHRQAKRVAAWAALCLMLCAACSEAPRGEPSLLDAGVVDAADAPTDVDDVPAIDIRDTPSAEDAERDLAADAPPQDVGPAPLSQSVALQLTDADTNGVRVGDCVHLHPGSYLSWRVDDRRSVGLDLEASSWRGEAARAVVGETHVGLHRIWSQRRWVAAVSSQPSAQAGYGAQYVPLRQPLTVAGDRPLRFVAGAEMDVCGARLTPPQAPIPDPMTPPQASALPEQTISMSPCGPDCDDGAAISTRIAEAEGPTTIRLAPGTFQLRSPLRIRRANVAVVGAGPDETVLRYDPATDNNWGAAVEVHGPSPGPELALAGVNEGQHTLVPDGAWTGERFAYIQADDYGEVPDWCRGGRDVERQFRHHNFLTELTASPTGLTSSRAFPYDLPEEANPRIAPIELLEGVAVRDLSIEGNCPEAADVPEHTQDAAECSNPHVRSVSGIRLVRAFRPEVRNVQVRYVGRFGVDATHTLEARVVGGGVALPADYGSGGAGYGVHTIRASRTLVFGYEVNQARHGVVVDFGSTETQIIASVMTTCTLAAIDVHGEASYDTVAIGNVVARSNGAVVVGGGGREVHCNDGPRHHFIGNEFRTAPVGNVWITDYSQHVSLRENTIEDSGYSVIVAAGSTDVTLTRNALRDATLGHILGIDAAQGTDRIRLIDNAFDGDPARWVEAEDGITIEGP